MRTEKMSASEAVAMSVSENRIVHIRASGPNDGNLSEWCEDDVKNGTAHEYWGITNDGDEWRVHTHIA